MPLQRKAPIGPEEAETDSRNSAIRITLRRKSNGIRSGFLAPASVVVSPLVACAKTPPALQIKVALATLPYIHPKTIEQA
jgi:hypothetical protein